MDSTKERQTKEWEEVEQRGSTLKGEKCSDICCCDIILMCMEICAASNKHTICLSLMCALPCVAIEVVRFVSHLLPGLDVFMIFLSKEKSMQLVQSLKLEVCEFSTCAMSCVGTDGRCWCWEIVKWGAVHVKSIALKRRRRSIRRGTKGCHFNACSWGHCGTFSHYRFWKH